MDNENNFETINCPLCLSAAFNVVYPGSFPKDLSQDFFKKTYQSSSDQKLFEQVVRCKECQLVYLNPRLKSNNIIDAYSEGEDPVFIKQDTMRVRTFKSALRKLSRKYNIILSDKTKVLDIGCAGGAFLRAARDLKLSVIGIEPSKWLGEHARSQYGLDVRSGTLFDHDFIKESFDLITLWDVIEHVPDPRAELREIRRILKADGLLVVNYPDFGSLAARLLGRRWPFLLSVHLVYYTRQTIHKQLIDAGFKIVSIKMHWQMLELGYILKRITAYFPFVKFIEYFVEKFGLGSIPIKYWMGQTQVIAKKC